MAMMAAAVLMMLAQAVPIEAPTSSAPPQRIRSVLLNPGENCPQAQGNEIVVCAPVESPYRLPPRFREGPVKPINQAWGARALTLDAEGRRASGIPDSCSPVGLGGQTGCYQQMIQRWAAERQAARRGETPGQ